MARKLETRARHLLWHRRWAALMIEAMEASSVDDREALIDLSIERLLRHCSRQILPLIEGVRRRKGDLRAHHIVQHALRQIRAAAPYIARSTIDDPAFDLHNEVTRACCSIWFLYKVFDEEPEE
jgi:hypothetical protein